jgi:hypothetical protein
MSVPGATLVPSTGTEESVAAEVVVEDEVDVTAGTVVDVVDSPRVPAGCMIRKTASGMPTVNGTILHALEASRSSAAKGFLNGNCRLKGCLRPF